MGKVLTKGNWPEVSLKIKHLSMLIQKYVERITSQAARELVLNNPEQPARSVDTASNVSVIMPLPLRVVLPPALYHMNIKLLDMSVYVRLDVNSYMEGLVAWQRYASFLIFTFSFQLLVFSVICCYCRTTATIMLLLMMLMMMLLLRRRLLLVLMLML